MSQSGKQKPENTAEPTVRVDAPVRTVAVLFARADSIYKTLPGCEVYDKERDARNFPGGMPVIAHPPCRAWGKLSHMAKPEPGEKDLAFFAVRMVRENGGILEHPASSKLWMEACLPLPGQPCDEWGGYSVKINQLAFGHKAIKSTWLYICGIDKKELPLIPIAMRLATHTVGYNARQKSRRLPEVTKSEREHTPPNLAKWLIEAARKTRSF